ncbi:hypothetical protein O6H91_19G040300 [Diphasiastrum complanatum]|uniref:Uncharacterized protein n=1 Tax=Diphasiastrum complanatum TaxID=34168 RepID=A0ACC2AUI4_DIPCM|nr:hypothetical protein O6H91_19G040300 [Diphasiastrum complanatum]
MYYTHSQACWDKRLVQGCHILICWRGFGEFVIVWGILTNEDIFTGHSCRPDGRPFGMLGILGKGADVNTPKLFAVVPSAAFAGAAVSVILCPTELIKCRLQVQAGHTNANLPDYQRYLGPLDCLQKTLKREGVQGLFRGWTATVFRESIGNAVFFTTYEFMRSSIFAAFNLDRSKVLKDNGVVNCEGEFQAVKLNSSPITQAFSEAAVGIVTGGIAGIAFWTTTLPLDVAKTRIQTTIHLNESTSIVHHITLMYKELGVKGLYAGLGPTLARAFPANAAAIVAWELCAKLLGIRHQNEV